MVASQEGGRLDEGAKSGGCCSLTMGFEQLTGLSLSLVEIVEFSSKKST